MDSSSEGFTDLFTNFLKISVLFLSSEYSDIQFFQVLLYTKKTRQQLLCIKI